jgi:hypothetical protein
MSFIHNLKVLFLSLRLAALLRKFALTRRWLSEDSLSVKKFVFLMFNIFLIIRILHDAFVDDNAGLVGLAVDPDGRENLIKLSAEVLKSVQVRTSLLSINHKNIFVTQ